MATLWQVYGCQWLVCGCSIAKDLCICIEFVSKIIIIILARLYPTNVKTTELFGLNEGFVVAYCECHGLKYS